jgi:hypothetical protein
LNLARSEDRPQVALALYTPQKYFGIIDQPVDWLTAAWQRLCRKLLLQQQQMQHLQEEGLASQHATRMVWCVPDDESHSFFGMLPRLPMNGVVHGAANTLQTAALITASFVCSVCSAPTQCLMAHLLLQVLPLAKVKRMMREHADVKTISADANFVLTRATVSPLAVHAVQSAAGKRQFKADVASNVTKHVPAQKQPHELLLPALFTKLSTVGS